MSPSRMRFMPEPGISRARYPCVCVPRRRLDAPSDKAQKRPFLGRLDASRTETPRSVFPPRKREKTDIPTAGDKTSPDAPYGSHICAHGNARMRHASMASRGFRGFRGYFQESKQSCGFASLSARGYFVDFRVTRGFIRGRGLIGERPGVPNARARHNIPDIPRILRILRIFFASH